MNGTCRFAAQFHSCRVKPKFCASTLSTSRAVVSLIAPMCTIAPTRAPESESSHAASAAAARCRGAGASPRCATYRRRPN